MSISAHTFCERLSADIGAYETGTTDLGAGFFARKTPITPRTPLPLPLAVALPPASGSGKPCGASFGGRKASGYTELGFVGTWNGPMTPILEFEVVGVSTWNDQ